MVLCVVAAIPTKGDEVRFKQLWNLNDIASLLLASSGRAWRP
jgi:hypothetical protein